MGLDSVVVGGIFTDYVHSWDVNTGKSARADARTQNNDQKGSIHWITWDCRRLMS